MKKRSTTVRRIKKRKKKMYVDAPNEESKKAKSPQTALKNVPLRW